MADAAAPAFKISRLVLSTMIGVLSWSVGEHGQLARLNQPFPIALDESIFGSSHRGRDHRAVLATTDGLPVRLVQGFPGFRERDPHVAGHVVQIRRRQSLR